MTEKRELVINLTDEALLEMLADLEHQQWAHWTEYMLDNLTEENIKHWKFQINNPYRHLTEKEKESDREWARKVLDILSNWWWRQHE